MLNVVSVVSVVMLNVTYKPSMPSVIMVNVVMLSVIAPFKHFKFFKKMYIPLFRNFLLISKAIIDTGKNIEHKRTEFYLKFYLTWFLKTKVRPRPEVALCKVAFPAETNQS